MAKKRTTKKQEIAKLNFLYGDAWKKHPALYQHAVHSNDTVRHCEYCGRPMNSSDVNDFGSLCENCYMKEYYGK